MVTVVVIPTLGGRHLPHCLDAATALDPPPEHILVVASGSPTPPVIPARVDLLHSEARLGFAPAVNAGISSLGDDVDRIALLNDDAVPAPGWIVALEMALDADPELAAVQGTVTDAVGATVDGRGITLDEVALPVQIDRGASPAPEPTLPKSILAVSGTASLYRAEALRQTSLAGGAVFDPTFGSYYEDLDLGLRLCRLGWKAAWVPGAWSSHIGSATARNLGWRHPWWVLTNRWRAFAGNLSKSALFSALPRLIRGEIRAVRTLARENPRTPVVAGTALAALPWLVTRAFSRPSPGPRLTALPEVNR